MNIATNPSDNFSPKRVAVYMRENGVCKDQDIAYHLSLSYYKGLQESNPAWAHVSFYTDDGPASFTMKFRDGFNRMIADAMNGMIDMIITRSVSRFSRNIGEALAVIRQLREKGVEVCFESEGFSALHTEAEKEVGEQ